MLRKLKHFFAVLLIYSWIFYYWLSSDFEYNKYNGEDEDGNVHRFFVIVFILVAVLCFTALPRNLMSLIGWTFNNEFVCYEKEVRYPSYYAEAPIQICFRYVTRGSYLDLTKHVIEELLDVCRETGFSNYQVEIVVDGPMMDLPKYPNVHQIVVPKCYATNEGTLFKARALCFANEPGQSSNPESAWIVHLDEESRISPSVLQGILDFCFSARDTAVIGTALCHYQATVSRGNVLATLLDSARIGYDLGCYRVGMDWFGKPLFGLRGSYHVIQTGEEKRLSYDVGRWGSLTEDYTLAMVASSYGYQFKFVRGFGSELAAFTISDLVRQRKRWIQGKLTILSYKGLRFTERLFVWYHAVTLVETLLLSFNFALIIFGYPCSASLPDFEHYFTLEWFIKMSDWARMVIVHPYLAPLPGRSILYFAMRFNYTVCISEVLIGLVHNFHNFKFTESPLIAIKLFCWMMIYHPVRVALDTLSCLWALKDIMKTDEFFVIQK